MRGSTAAISSARFISSCPTTAEKGKLMPANRNPLQRLSVRDGERSQVSITLDSRVEPPFGGTLWPPVRRRPMTLASPTGAIRIAASPRTDLLAFEIVDHLAEPDVEWMAEEVEAGFAREDVVDMLIVMRPWRGIDPAAAVDRDMLRSMSRSLRHVRRYAVAGAPAWAQALIALGRPLTPVTERTFDDEVEARRWIGG